MGMRRKLLVDAPRAETLRRRSGSETDDEEWFDRGV
jgi:hypothetical protein